MDAFRATVVIATVGSGVMAGLFFAFSTSVMRALGTRPSLDGLATMRAINRAILNPVFLASFLATAAACGAVLVGALLREPDAGRGLLVAGALTYLVGGLGVTAVCNVPRNNALDRLDPASPAAAERWNVYLREWTRWNHIRTVASLIAATLLALGSGAAGA